MLPSGVSRSGPKAKAHKLKDEVERLQNELDNLRVQSELPEAANLLNQLKAKRKKSTSSLADVEALLEMIEGKAQKGN